MYSYFFFYIFFVTACYILSRKKYIIICDGIWENQPVNEKINYCVSAELVVRARMLKEKEARFT